MNPDFGELRSLVQQPPATPVFEEICEVMQRAFEQVPDAWEQMWLPYATQSLARWPGKMLEPDRAQRDAMLEGPTGYSSLVRFLNVGGNALQGERFEQLKRAEHLRHVTHVDLGSSGLGWGELASLALQDDLFERLEYFQFRAAVLEHEAFADMLQRPWLGHLEHLDFSGWASFGARDVGLLSKTSWLEGLRVLDLGGCSIGMGGCAALAHTAGGKARWEVLDLSRNEIGESGTRALADTGCTAHLHTLNLEENKLGLKELEPLFGSEHLRSLRHLNIGKNSVTDEVVEALVGASFAPQLESLDLTPMHMSAFHPGGQPTLLGYDVLSEQRHLTSLKSLVLGGAAFDDDCAELIAASRGLPALESLRMDAVSAGERGLRALAESPHLERVRELRIYQQHIAQSPVAPALRGSPLAMRLTRLELPRFFDPAHTRETLRAIFVEEAFPNLRHVHLEARRLGREDTQMILESSLLERLEVLNLGRTAVPLSFGRGIAEHPGSSNLREFVMGYVPWSYDDERERHAYQELFEAMQHSPHLSSGVRAYYKRKFEWSSK